MFIEAKDDGGGSNSWSCKSRKVPVKSSPPTNQHRVFTGRMPFLSPNQQCQSTEGKTSHSMDLLTPSSPGGLPTLSLTTNSSWLPWRRVAMPLISYLMPVPQNKIQSENWKLGIMTEQEIMKIDDRICQPWQLWRSRQNSCSMRHAFHCLQLGLVGISCTPFLQVWKHSVLQPWHQQVNESKQEKLFHYNYAS